MCFDRVSLCLLAGTPRCPRSALSPRRLAAAAAALCSARFCLSSPLLRMSHGHNPFLDAVAAAQQVDELPKRRQNDNTRPNAARQAIPGDTQLGEANSRGADRTRDECEAGRIGVAQASLLGRPHQALLDLRLTLACLPLCSRPLYLAVLAPLRAPVPPLCALSRDVRDRSRNDGEQGASLCSRLLRALGDSLEPLSHRQSLLAMDLPKPEA